MWQLWNYEITLMGGNIKPTRFILVLSGSQRSAVDIADCLLRIQPREPGSAQQRLENRSAFPWSLRFQALTCYLASPSRHQSFADPR